MRYIIDTFAWIEYFKGTAIGTKIRDIIESGENVTPTIVLAELKNKFVEWKRTDFDEKLLFIKSNSEVIPLDEDVAILSGEIRATINIKGIGLIDCILIAMSRLYDLKVLTGDPHFKDLDEAEYLGGNNGF